MTTTETTTQATPKDAALTFADIAKPMARIGLSVIRTIPQDKKPRDKAWETLATTDEDTILRWSEETPDCGAGLVAKEDFVFLETDQPGVYKKFLEETGAAFETLTQQSSPGHFHFIFKSTPLSKKLGPITQKELGFGSLRSGNQYILAAGSIHPRTGGRYKIVRNAPIIAIPDALVNWLAGQKKSERNTNTPSAPEAKIEAGGRNSALTSYAGKLRHDGLEQSEIETVLMRYNAANCEPPLPEAEIKTIARSVARYERGSQAPTVTIGGTEPGAPLPLPSEEELRQKEERQALIDSTPERFEDDPTTSDSQYPYWVWAQGDSLYQEFADFCGRGNVIPKELFLEAIKSVVGAICGHRFSPQEGRFYTFLLTKIGGIGKGTAIGAALDLFAGTGMIGDSAFFNIGTAKDQFGSSAGMLNNGFTKHDRIFQVYDELTKLLEKFSIPGSGDAFLDDLNSLYEASNYSPTITKDVKLKSDFAPERKRTSILGGTTFDKWNSAFGKTTAEGSGFFQRLNLVSSDEAETVPEIPKFNFNEGEGLALREKFIAKITPLEFQLVLFEKTPEAEKLFDDWHKKFKKQHADDPAETTGRLNVLVSRNYEHLAFASAPAVKPAPEKATEPIRVIVDESVMQKAIALAEYQFFVRTKHRPAQGGNDSALVEDSIRLTLLASPGQRMNRSDLYKKSGSKKFGLLLFNKVLDIMQSEGLIDVGEKSTRKTRGRKSQVIVWVGD